MKCPYCGAETKSGICEYCGSELQKEKSENDSWNMNPEKLGYEFERGRQRAQAEAQIHEEDDIKNNDISSGDIILPRKKRKTWLWVLGWVFIFPVPLTILMLRKKNMNKVLKYMIIAVAWVVYLGIAKTGDDNNQETTMNNSVEMVVAPEAEVKHSISEEAGNKTIEYDALQNIFLKLQKNASMSEIESLSKEFNLKYTVQDYNGTTKSTVIKLAYTEKTALQKYSDEGDYLEASFDKQTGVFMYAEYFNYSEFSSALLYNYGTYRDFRETEPDNRYEGYYYHQSGDSEGGITMEYSNGNKHQTGYYECSDGEEALSRIFSE